MKKESDSAKSLALWLFVVLLLLLIILGGITLVQKKGDGNIATAEKYHEESTPENSVTEFSSETAAPETTTTTAEIDVDFDHLDLDSETILLSDLEGNEYFSKNQNEIMYPASLTKIMTAIVALESIDDIDEKVIITGDIYNQVVAENGSTAGFIAYEQVSYRDLLYGAVLSSGAECCLTLANYIAGCEWNYVQLMNEKADELGLENTHFKNVCGFHDSEHYSTAADMASLLQYALENDTFYEIFTSQSYYTETDERPDGITLQSTMFSEMDSSDITGGKILGGKTGFTDEAGLCLASLAEIDGKLYTLVTAGAPGSHNTEPMHINDAKKLYEKLAE